MSQQQIQEITKEQLKTDLPKIDPGDTVRVFVKIVEGGKERIQAYEGTVIKLRNASVSKTITVRKVFKGIGVERIFPIHSPRIDSIKVLKKGKVRRAKLYYLRALDGKSSRIKEKQTTFVKAKKK